MVSILNCMVALFGVFQYVQCTHFYLKPNEVKCFYENLASGNLLIGDLDVTVEGQYGIYEENPDVSLSITIDETFDNDHRVFNQKNSFTGDFTFTTLETGEHRVCIRPHYKDTKAKLRIYIDFEISHIRYLDSKRKEGVTSLKGRIDQLTQRLYNIRTEQEVIRKKEAIFRNQSESANSKIMFWSVVQCIALAGACAFQLRYLKNFSSSRR
ncbi:Erp5p KNAG_0B04260 [Huiozyma naganishii CBS 8797]|uniref:GOLD domain-containing protein n=1 Tax=Huiozyma naganishii (strain ATCC MYA-139 / BCRC 22969 / CBS 8797 / KCTC 17520 / NBRC 10181 / NCYC 3082 / Yp74L-3) TaxID=1071383 RepID=J7S4X6_HUIN7|nr:hypothetical protein KNAG_0B04260 [Kazachstania naganishii CBS 8797]CCK68861.1 hypothetical protein KNAG_0B04260 [Kazachstania naganishii CBS 8797]